MDYLQIIDVNINRAAEGLRVVEEIARFRLRRADVCGRLKGLRHSVRALADRDMPLHRDVQADYAISVKATGESDSRADVGDVFAASCKRVQEALRCLEEYLKIAGRYEQAKLVEGYRFAAYDIERRMCLYMRKKLYTPADTDLYCITAAEYAKGRSTAYVVGCMLEADVKLIQYREKNKHMREKYAECMEVRKLTEQAGATFIVNDSVDLAILCGADGVHVGQDDLPVDAVRRLAPDMLVGLSTHSVADAQGAVAANPDYIGVGPIFATQTKADYTPVGYTYLHHVRDNVQLPYVAIGGIKERNIAEVFANGAYCCAIVSEIVEADNITQKIKQIQNITRG